MSPTLTIEDLLRKQLVSGPRVPVPEAEQWRTEFGRNLTLQRIASALTATLSGYMVEMADLIAETIDIDPHLACVINKRIGALTRCNWVVDAAQGDGIEKAKAREIADAVRKALEEIPQLKQGIRDLAWGLCHGRSALENHWITDGEPPFGRRVVELAWIHPRRLSFGPCRELRLVDTSSYYGDFIPQGLDLSALAPKFTTFTPRLFNEYPEREGFGLRVLFWSYFKRYTARERMVLIELFGKAFKILEVENDGPEDPKDMDDAVDQAEALDGHTVAQFPKGIKFRLEHPHPDSADAHHVLIQDCDFQISKLVLGNTATTDVQASGLNSNTSRVQKEEQNIFLDDDGGLISGAIQQHLVAPMVLLNYGQAFRRYIPTFRIQTAPAKDAAIELQTAKLFMDLGGPIALDELRTVSGYRKPAQDEPIVQIVDSPQLNDSARYVPPRPRVIDPTGTEAGQDSPKAPHVFEETSAPPAAPSGATSSPPADPTTKVPTELDIDDDEAWDIARGPVMRIQQDLAGLEVDAAADGVTNFPKRGDNLRVSLRNSGYKLFPYAEAEALKAEWPDVWKKGGNVLGNMQFGRLVPIAKRGGVVETDTEEEAVRLREAWAARHYSNHELAGVVAQVKWLVVGEIGLERMRRVIAEEKAKIRERRASASGYGAPLMLAAEHRPVYGSPETIVERGTDDGAEVTDRWAEEFADAVEDKATVTAIRAALRSVAARLDEQELARTIEPRQAHAAMLGALDAEWEAQNDEPIRPATFAGGPSGFVAKPFAEAIAWFRAKKVVTKSVFDGLLGKAKRAAFTIAGLAKTEMLETAFDELGKAVAAGLDLRKFRKALDARFVSAGWTKLNTSHVETVFRNATMGAYASGRKAQMTQPAVLKARPYWQIVTVRDDRTRATHRAAHNKVLRADDPFWESSPIPWGHNCRCRVVSRSERDVKRLGLTVVDGSSLRGLPDAGWDSSISMIV